MNMIALQMAALVLMAMVPILLTLVWAKSVVADNDEPVYVNQTQMQYAQAVQMPVCFIELLDQKGGYRMKKTFRGRLLLGRRLAEQENSGRLYLGSEVTISRNQFRITGLSDGIVIENMSKVNMTYLNGYPVSKPMLLRKGDRIDAGGHGYLVSGLERVA